MMQWWTQIPPVTRSEVAQVQSSQLHARIRSVDTAASPTEVTDWEYDYHGHDGHGSWRPAGIAVREEED